MEVVIRILDLFTPGTSCRDVPLARVVRAAETIRKSQSFTTMQVVGEDFRVTFRSSPAARHMLDLTPVPEPARLEVFLDAFHLEHTASGRSCKLRFKNRIPERNSTNVLAVHEFLARALTQLYPKQQTYGVVIKNKNRVLVKEILEKALRA